MKEGMKDESGRMKAEKRMKEEGGRRKKG